MSAIMINSSAFLSLLFLLGLISSASSWGRSPFQMRCEETLTHKAVVVSSSQSDYHVDNTVSSRVLNKMSIHTYASEQMLGLTELQSSIEIEFDGPVLQDSQSGTECLAPRIQVALRYMPIKVYVAREFAEGSCPYEEVLTHELRHVQVYRENLPKVEAQLRSALAQRFPPKLLYAPTGHSKLVLRHDIDTKWLPYIKEEMAKVETIQLSLDSEEETYRLSHACAGEVAVELGLHY
jgi:hypothetical protein